MKTNHDILGGAFPETPQGIDRAIGRAVASIRAEERMAYAHRVQRVFVLVLVIALLLGAVAYAAQHWNLFDALKHLTGASPEYADQIMQSDLAHVTVNGVDITVREAGYDGKTLFIRLHRMY